MVLACAKYGQFKCNNSICIDHEERCDKKDNCGDASDEYLCDCKSNLIAMHTHIKIYVTIVQQHVSNLYMILPHLITTECTKKNF